MKLSKCRGLLYCIVISAFVLCACQSQKGTDETNVGIFDISKIESAPLSEPQQEDQHIVISDSFNSTDGSVEFIFDISQSISNANVPVVQVQPHFLTEEDVKKVATALWGDADYYEARPLLNAEYSVDEIRAKIERWAEYSSSTALYELYGRQQDNVEDLVKSFIKEYAIKCETASDKSPKHEAEWQFRKASYYDRTEDKINAADLVLDNDEIAVELLSNGMPYRLVAFTRNKSDFKLNYISAYLYDGISPNMIDERIFKSKLCRTSAPSDQQISEAKQTASSMLEEMGLGEWYIDNAQVETKYYGDIPEYSIRITATPVFNTANVIRQPQLSNLKRDDVFASNYYLTDAEFIFSPNGQLIRFEMYSPVDVEKVIVDNVKTLEMLEQFECAKNILALSEYRDYLLSQDLIEELEKTNKESLICKVEISDFEYGLTRIKAPNEDDIYYYIPGILLKGSIDYLGKDSHNIYASTGLELGPDRTLSLITLNSIDGTIIHN